MRISKAADYSVRALIYLSTRDEPGPVGVTEISGAMEVSKNYLVKVLKNLVRAGLVRSFRGSHGGYTIAKKREDITLRNAVEASDGPIALNACLDGFGCGHSATCGIFGAWADVQNKLVEVLESYSIADLSAPFKGTAAGKGE